MKVRDEIKKYSEKEDKSCLLWLLDNYSLESKWYFVASCVHVKFGEYSHQTHRVWFPTKEGRVLYNYHLMVQSCG